MLLAALRIFIVCVRFYYAAAATVRMHFDDVDGRIVDKFLSLLLNKRIFKNPEPRHARIAQYYVHTSFHTLTIKLSSNLIKPSDSYTSHPA